MTTAGARMPLDAAPTPDGNLVLDGATVHHAPPADLFDRRDRYTSHFASCPQAGTWRKSRG